MTDPITLHPPVEKEGQVTSENVVFWFVRKLVMTGSFTQAINHVAWRAFNKGIEAGRQEAERADT